MAEINKLSVGKVIEKLRSNDASNSSKIAQLEEKTKVLDEEIERMRAADSAFSRADPPRPSAIETGQGVAVRHKAPHTVPSRAGRKPQAAMLSKFSTSFPV